jgi:alcohol dehydrogenase (nicotinoprotein)
MMKTRAAVLTGYHQPFQVMELELDEPGPHEVLLKMSAAGLCHSDLHMMDGDNVVRFPIVGGHEAAGIVEQVGPGVTKVQPGDHVVCSFTPACGICRYCSTGRQNLCDQGLNAGTGILPGGGFRFREGDVEIGGMCVLGTFSERAVVPEWSCVPIAEDLPFDASALVGCGVTTGWSSAVHAGGTRAGDTVVVFGTGGVGINAVQGAKLAGAKYVVAVDPVDFKLEMAQQLGATHGFNEFAKAKDAVIDLTRGQLADVVVITVGSLTSEVVQQAVEISGKGSTIVLTAVGDRTASLTVPQLIGYHRRFQGSLFGGANPLYDIPKLLGLYRTGHLKLDEIITRRYSLEQVNDGYRDMLDGKNIRGVIIHE